MSEINNHGPGERKRVNKLRLSLITASLVWLVFCLILLIMQKFNNMTILPDDGYLPISQGEYWVKWNKNVFTLAVDRGYADGSWAKMKVILGEGGKKVEEEVFYPFGEPSDYKDEER
ncbi:hypothetical protein [Kallipyga massiliensis]|uniref:hypothetical protein n=1 Tax=Kallipyga massiliensis TaxID=1472764 RepID=UPI0004B8C097|nr:hypothetical protein [Kallipyga massiliensis]